MSPSFHVTQYLGTGIHVGEAADRGLVPKPARREGSPPTTSLEANVLPRAACTTKRDTSFLLRTLRTHDREASERRRCNRDSKGMESTSETRRGGQEGEGRARRKDPHEARNRCGEGTRSGQGPTAGAWGSLEERLGGGHTETVFLQQVRWVSFGKRKCSLSYLKASSTHFTPRL